MVASCFEVQSFEPEKVGDLIGWLLISCMRKGFEYGTIYEENALVQENLAK